MKRSEMLSKIQGILELFYGQDSAKQKAVSLAIMDSIENHGMLPPHTIIVGSKDEMEGHIQNCVWEPE